MNSIYEELKRQLGDGFDPKAGFSTLDMIHFPAPVRRIIRIMLRKAEISHEELHKTIQELPEEKRPSEKEVEESLDAMIKVGWLERIERDGSNHYRIDMGKKAGSEVTRASPSQKTKSTMSKLWDTFDKAAKDESKPALDLRRDKGKPSPMDALADLGKEEKKETPSQKETPPAPAKAEQSPAKAASKLSGSPEAATSTPDKKPDEKEFVKETKDAASAPKKTAKTESDKSERGKKTGKSLLDSLFKSGNKKK
jgi:hypothetical protein